jgi:hypothetical protein
VVKVKYTEVVDLEIGHWMLFLLFFVFIILQGYVFGLVGKAAK